MGIEGSWRWRASLGAGGVLLLLSGCTSLDTLDEEGIQQALDDANNEIVIPDAGPGPDASFESDKLCEYPPTPPRIPAASIDERTCSTSSEDWPDCLPDECDAGDFMQACQQFCQMNCEREDWFCDRSHCDPPSGSGTYCDTDAALQECMDLCNGDAACLNDLCADRREVTCSDYACADNGQNLCEGQTCDNSCDTAFNGVCEDGSPINSTGDSCAIGTDCADCGAREDECFPLGAECFSTAQCCGFEDFSAWCVGVADDPELGPLGRCVAACPDNECDKGFNCYGLEGGGDACFPFCSDSQ